MNRLALVPLVALLAVPASHAFAQDVSTAKALFEKGVNDMQAGNTDAACPEITESYRLDPRAGTLFTMAECFSKAGKIASAVARYEDYLSAFGRMTPEEQSKQHGRDATAAQKRDEIKPHVPLLTLRLDPAAPEGTTVTRDGEVLGKAILGIAIPVDPGPHKITTQAPGAAVSTETITLAPDGKQDVVLKVTAAPAPQTGTTGNPGPGPGPNPPMGQSGPTQPGPASDEGRGNTQRIAGISIASVGGVFLIVGAATGGVALSKKSTITANCNLTAKTCKNATGEDAVNSAQTMGTVSTAGFVVGGLLAVTGIVVAVTAPHATHTASNAPQWHVGLGAGSASLSGEF